MAYLDPEQIGALVIIFDSCLEGIKEQLSDDEFVKVARYFSCAKGAVATIGLMAENALPDFEPEDGIDPGQFDPTNAPNICCAQPSPQGMPNGSTMCLTCGLSKTADDPTWRHLS